MIFLLGGQSVLDKGRQLGQQCCPVVLLFLENRLSRNRRGLRNLECDFRLGPKYVTLFLGNLCLVSQ